MSAKRDPDESFAVPLAEPSRLALETAMSSSGTTRVTPKRRLERRFVETGQDAAGMGRLELGDGEVVRVVAVGRRSSSGTAPPGAR